MKIVNSYPWPPKELNPNIKLHWRKEAKIKRLYKRDCYYLTERANLSHEQRKADLHLDLIFYPPDRIVRDLDNLEASCKALIDGMCAKLFFDDKNIKTKSSKFGNIHKNGAVEAILTWQT